MPTKKPRIQAIVEEDIYKTFKTICEEENRSESNMASYIITKYVREHAKQKFIKDNTLSTSKIG